VELRYSGGLTINETAEVVGISTATVVREWTIGVGLPAKPGRPKAVRQFPHVLRVT